MEYCEIGEKQQKEITSISGSDQQVGSGVIKHSIFSELLVHLTRFPMSYIHRNVDCGQSEFHPGPKSKIALLAKSNQPY